ncbi:MAG: class I SAM-dependent methyltransferase [Methanobacteriaceae archaeon]|jgi:ubiquinone/menaquinone biosynthesis C-methylase UbiE|nr:MAG: methyltransferase type 11 [Methanobacterium sp. BRmetb2]MCC7557800.1 class I SAM-dependent methyltransferase [Methanobacteriaceae archaeon]
MLTGFKLRMLNRRASSPKNKPLKIIEKLNIEKGMVVGDVGTGGGYFAIEFSKKVGQKGKVYAIDINKEFLDFISDNIEKKGIKNIEIKLANPYNLNLPGKSVDLFFQRNVFHHLSEPLEYFKNIKKILKDNGRIAIIDYKKKKFSFTGLFGHYTSKNTLIETMDSAGFSPLENFDFLQDQLFIIFESKS